MKRPRSPADLQSMTKEELVEWREELRACMPYVSGPADREHLVMQIQKVTFLIDEKEE